MNQNHQSPDVAAAATGNFSVIQFFVDGSGERVLERASVSEAMEKARWFSTSVGARLGTTNRVVILEDNDAIVFEWKFGKGITFPPQFVGRDWIEE